MSSPDLIRSLKLENRELRARLDVARADRINAHGDKVLIRTLNALPSFAGACTVDGVMVEANRAALVYAGLDPDDALGKPLWETYWWAHDARVQDELQTALAAAAKGRGSRYLVPIRVAGGDLITIDFQVEPIRDGEGHITELIVSGMDVTDRMRFEEELQRSERRLRLALEAGAMGTWRWNLADDSLELDEVMRGIWDIGPHEHVSSEDIFGRIHSDDVDGVRAAIDAAAGGDQRYAVEFRALLSGDRMRWISARGDAILDDKDEVIGFVGVSWDTTEAEVRKQAQADLEHEREIAIEVAELGIWQLDVTTDTLHLDLRSCECFGLAPDASTTLSRDSALALVHPDDRAGVERALAAAVELDGDGRYRVEFRVNTNAGECWVRSTARCFFSTDALGNRVAAERLFGVHQNITEQRLNEAELERAQRVAEAANRAKSEFLANMSHEIRTPMTAILGFADILALHVSNPDNLELVETIRRNGSHLLEIINDILDLAKIESGQFTIATEAVAPEFLVEDVASLMGLRAHEAGIELETRFVGEVPRTVETDATRLRQVLLNLIGNAIKFTDRGAVVIETGYNRESGQLWISVIDSGIGIEPDQLERLFLPFTQADTSARRSHGGTGLGLTICRRLCRALGGELSAESTPRVGSRFTVTIPAGDVEAAGVHQVTPGRADPPAVPLGTAYGADALAGRRILVVDDRRELRALLQFLIEDVGAEVRTAIHGADALEKLVAPGAHYDGVLLDMQMPVMDGYAAVRAMRERGFNLPVIAVTAHALRGEQEACIEAGCNAYTAKPIDSEELVRLLVEHIRGAPEEAR